MMYTTLNEIRIHGPCEPGWVKLLKHPGKIKADSVDFGTRKENQYAN